VLLTTLDDLSSSKIRETYSRNGEVSQETDRDYWFSLYWNPYKKLKDSYFKVPHVYRMSFDLKTRALGNFPKREPRLAIQTAAWFQMSADSLESLRREVGWTDASGVSLITANDSHSHTSTLSSNLSEDFSSVQATDSD
jgi:hypothetical protein